MDYFKDLAGLLKIEQAEDRRLYQQLAQGSSIAERRTAGLAWYPIAIRDTEPGRGDYLMVEVERTTHLDISHQLRSGAAAVLFSQHDPHTDRVEGTISFVGVQRLKITLNTDELPDWTRNGKLGIELLFDDNSYNEMFAALRQASALAGKSEEGRLVRILSGMQIPEFLPPHPGQEPRPGAAAGFLNASQQIAVEKILSAVDLAIVHGPPGTGKTTTLVRAIEALCRRVSSPSPVSPLPASTLPILVTAPSNTAVDLLTERLSDIGLNVLRVGNPARVSERLMSLTLDDKMAAHSSMKEIKRLRKKASEFKDMAHKYKRSFGPAEREQRKALFDEARNLLKEVDRLEQYILDDLLSKTQVITATLVGANHYSIRNKRFHTAVIDEAGQALEPACWIPILKARQVILAGDHCQLPPTIKSDEAARKGLSVTMLEKCTALYPDAVVLLEEQYRMHSTIMGYSSDIFYQDRLKAHPTVATQLLFAGDSPLTFIDTAGCGFEEKSIGSGISNPEEGAFLIRQVGRIAAELSAHYGELRANGQSPANRAFPTIGIISPYRSQVDLLRELIRHSPSAITFGDKLSVNTIDSFQGQERDIIIIGLTRSNPDNKIGFLSEIRRMNVAMTRARKKLVVIGDSGTLARQPFYAGFIAYAERVAGYRSAWEFAED